MKIKNIVKWLFLPFLGAMVLVFLLAGFGIFSIWYDNTYKTEIQTIKLPEKGIKFVLLKDLSGFDDVTWYVYKIGIDASLTDVQKKAGETSDVLFYNYSEAGEHCENPYIRFVKGKYLIFSRGNLDYSLYDLSQDKVLVNEYSVWGVIAKKYMSSPDYKEGSGYEDNQLMNEWAFENLHKKINAYIK